MEKQYRHQIALVIATKDRPDALAKMLETVQQQSLLPAQIVIVDAGAKPVKSIVNDFPTLHITYIAHFPPSAAQQRNAGLNIVRNHCRLIGFLDDDIGFAANAIENMLQFWETAPADVAGVAFNLLNPASRALMHLKKMRWATTLGVYDRKIGNVAPSGWQTAIETVEQNLWTQWLPSTAVVWRRHIFDEYRFDDYFVGYSYLEDVDFSYSVAQKYRIGIVANAGFYHYMCPAARDNGYQFGKMEVHNRLFLVRKHKLSMLRCYFGIWIRLLMTFTRGIIKADRYYLHRALGNIVAMHQ